MARIPDEELERIKMSVDLVALVRAKGIALTRHGENLIGRCPFHDDRTPSFVVTPAKNLWHCLGACQSGGSVIDFVMRIEKMTFRHAVELLRSQNTAAVVEKRVRLRAPKLDSPITVDSADQTVLNDVTEFYHETLLSGSAPEAAAYLDKRGINDQAAIKQFKIGFANRTLGLRLPEKRRPDGGWIRDKLMSLGLYRKSGHEHFNGCIVFPVTDENGNVTDIYGRRIEDQVREGLSVHFYLPGPHKGVWNLAGLTGQHEVILCESIIDAMSFWVNGYQNVTASYGIEGFTKEHLAVFKQNQVRRVLIAYDRDKAGDLAAEKLAEKLKATGIESKRVLFPRGMDANEYILKVKPARASLKVCLEASVWLKRLGTTLAIEPKPVEAASPAACEPAPVAEVESPAVPSDNPETLTSENEASHLAADPEKTEIFRAPEQTTHEPVAATASPATGLEVVLRGEDVLLTIGTREYRVRGLKKNLSFEILRVNLRIAIGEEYYVDTLDLYQAKARSHFIHAASRETKEKEEIIKADLGKVLFKLEELQEAAIKKALESDADAKKPVVLSEAERAEAQGYLQMPELLERILSDFDGIGVVGEETNKLMAYLAATSRKLDEPLAVIIQSASAAGKSSLMDAVLALIPEEDKVKYSSMTGQSLFYMGEKDLKHKILAISEEQGAQSASYALKLLQSEGEISIASTGKDALTGRLTTHQYRVEGPVMIMLTTTAIEVDEELLNRCVVLTVNESREHTKAIHDLQRRVQTLEGRLAKQERERILNLHQNAQRILRPVLVVNPFAEKLTFLDSRTRTRRDHMKYLTLIRTIALLHQYQRESKWTTYNGKSIEYIEVIPSDIATANRLCHQVLGRSLDELPPQSRKLLKMMSAMVSAACAREQIEIADYHFTRKTLREYTGWSDFQVRVHMAKLVELEYVLPHRGGRGQSFVYELIFNAKDAPLESEPYLSGLIDPKMLVDPTLTHQLVHENVKFEGSSSPHLAPIVVGSRCDESHAETGLAAKNEENAKNARSRDISPTPIIVPETESITTSAVKGAS